MLSTHGFRYFGLLDLQFHNNPPPKTHTHTHLLRARRVYSRKAISQPAAQCSRQRLFFKYLSG